MQWETLWRFKTARFRVELQATQESDADISWDDTGEVRDKLQSGEWTCLCFRVAVYLDGKRIADNYLGNSIYGNARDFYTEHLGIRAMARADGRNYGDYFSDMVKTAIAEARAALRNPPKLRVAS